MRTFLSLALLFLGLYLPGIAQNSISSITPDTASLGQNLTVSITGAGTSFGSATGVALSRGQGNYINATNYTVNSATQITADFDLPAMAYVGGDWDVTTFTNSNRLLDGFYVEKAQIDSISPNNGNLGQQVVMDIYCTNFDFNLDTGIVLYTYNQVIPAVQYTINSPTHMTAVFDIPYGARTGNYRVRSIPSYTNSVQANSNGIYTVAHPSLSSISQDSAFVRETFTMDITGVNTDFYQATGIALSKPNSTPIYATTYTVNSSTSITAEFHIPSGSPTGSYSVIEYPSNAGLFYGFYVKTTPPPGTDGKIAGRFYWDQFNNGSYQWWQDNPYDNSVITFQPGNYTALTNSNGQYEIWLPAGTYTVTANNPNPTGLNWGTPANGSQSVTISTYGQQILNQDFVLLNPPFRDLSGHMAPVGIARPGFNWRMNLIGRNRSNTNDSLVITYVHDPVLTISNSSVTPTSYSGDTAIWIFTNVPGDATRSVAVDFTMPVIPTISLGQQLHHWLEVGPLVSDVNPSDNSDTLSVVVFGSYDPNDKQVYPQACGPTGITSPNDSLLTYLIRFQNTGTDTAFNIRVRDTLDPDLDWGTLQMIDASHNYNLTMGPNGELDWFFPNILLLDSNRNEPESHGYILYTIETQPGISIGAGIENTAHIYFDFNPAVITNTTQNTVDTTFCSFAGVDQYLCVGDSGYLNAFLPSLSTGSWSLLNGSGTLADPNDPNSQVFGLSTGANTFLWTLTNSISTTYDSVTIFITGSPTADAGPDQAFCIGQPTLLNGTGVGLGNWSIIQGYGIFGDRNAPATTLENLANGINEFVWTVSAGTCIDQDTIRVTVYNGANLAVSAGNPDTLCIGNTAQLQGSPSGAGTGMWSVIAGSALIADSTDPVSNITVLSPGIIQLVWTVTNGSCGSGVDTVEWVALPGLTPAVAGMDQTLCAGGVTTGLSGNMPINGAGSWTVASGSGGSFSNPSDPATSFTTTGLGSFELVWTIAQVGCGSSSDTVRVTFGAAPTTANAGPDQTICGLASPITLVANTPQVGAGQWTIVSGSGSLSNNNDPVTQLNNFSYGQTDLTWTVSTAHCGSSTDSVSLSVSGFPSVANAGSDQLMCGGTTTTLMGNVPTIGTGTWTVLSGGGTLSNPLDPTTTIAGLSAGQQHLIWTVSTENCGDEVDTMAIQIDVPPTIANAGPDLNLCVGSGVSLGGNAPTVGSGIWTQTGGPATTITNPADPGSSLAGLGVGTYTFEWTISNLSCPPSVDAVEIVVNPSNVLAVAGSDTAVCENIVTLNATTPATGTGMWSLISGNGAFVSMTDPQSIVSGLAQGNNVFVWTITGGGPCDIVLDTVTVAFAAPVIPVVTVNGSLLSSTAAVSYQWNLNGTPISGATNQDYVIPITGSYSVTTIDANGCSATSDVVMATGRREVVWGQAVKVYPNPTLGTFWIELETAFAAKVDIRVIDMTGRILLESKDLFARNLRTEIDIRDVAAGMYYVKIEMNGQKLTRKLVKQ